MLSLAQKIAFVLFTLLVTVAAAFTWTRVYRVIARGRGDTDLRFDRPIRRLAYAITTTLTQRRTFRKRPMVSFFHSLIFYGFVFYLLVNLLDAAEGFLDFSIHSNSALGFTYNALADTFSALVLLGVVFLILRRFFLPSRRDFRFNSNTVLHDAVKRGAVRIDSALVSAFILLHVGSRAIGAGAKLLEEGPDRAQPFATLISLLLRTQDAHLWRVLGYWGALGSVLLFLVYFPRSKHIHIFFAPGKYVVAREASSGVLPLMDLLEGGTETRLGASHLEDLAWPRLLDAYACIQCNRCQDVCPATATGKSLSPSALEINKRMELNALVESSAFTGGAPSPRPLLKFALSVEALWACTTCGACLEVCPVQDEPMLDIIDMRRQQVMMEGVFPAQLQTAFRGMERTSNPWAISQEKRMDWAEGLRVRTIDEHPEAEVLFWVGCAASYDPQSQKTARAFVQLLNHAGVDFAVLGKKECCTGDTARRAGNEYLYRQLADHNVAVLNEVSPKLIVATCPHCMNAIGKEYAQIGGNYKVIHHTEYLERLMEAGRLEVMAGGATMAFHDPCYLGRHKGVYDSPRNLLHVLGSSVVELERNRENSFCCGAGGAQFWKEEEPGAQRISDNRYIEAERMLGGADEGVLAVGCPFCKGMLESTPGRRAKPIEVRDIAELMLEGVERKLGRAREIHEGGGVVMGVAGVENSGEEVVEEHSESLPEKVRDDTTPFIVELTEPIKTLPQDTGESASASGIERKKWVPKGKMTKPISEQMPKASAAAVEAPASGADRVVSLDVHGGDSLPNEPVERKVWNPKRSTKVE